MKVITVGAIILLLGGGIGAQNLVSEQAVHQAVKRFVRAELEGWVEPQQRFEIFTRWQGDIELGVGGDVEISVRRISVQPFHGPTVVRVELQVAGETRRALTVTVDTRFFKEVLVTTRGIRRGEDFRADMFELIERDITAEKDGYFTDFEALAGLQAKRPLGFDRILTHRYVEKVPVVHRGDEVQLVVVTGNMRISTLGIALQDGGLGTRIRVRNVDSGKILQGEIVDSTTLKVTL